jgi:hypothetical protein
MRCRRLPRAPDLVAAVVASIARAGVGEPGRDDPSTGTPRLAQNPAGQSKEPSTARDLVDPTKQSTFKPPRVTSADLLATGDQRVNVSWSDAPALPRRSWLVRLEKPWGILREAPRKEPTLTTAASRKILEIATTDGKFKWKLNPDKEIFEGKAQPSPATEEVRVVPRPAESPRQVEQFLLLRLLEELGGPSRERPRPLSREPERCRRSTAHT